MSKICLMKRVIPLFIACFAFFGAHPVIVAESASFSQAVPVWVEGDSVSPKTRETEPNLTVAFRAEIKLANAEELTLRIAAASDYRAHVNGQFLAHGPCVAAKGWHRIDELPLKPLLKKGSNIVAVEVAGYNVDSYYLVNQPAFLQAEIVAPDGRVLASTMPANTATPAKAPRFYADVNGQRLRDSAKFSFQRTFAEDYRLNQGYQDWMRDMKAAFGNKKLAQTEFKKLLPRGVKYPDYTILRPVKKLDNGIFKLSHNATGFVGLTLNVVKDARVEVIFDEILNRAGDIKERRNSRGNVIYDLTRGHYELESFEPYTLQYIKVKVHSGEIAGENVYLRQYVNADTARARFETSDPDFTKIFTAAAETSRQNALDVFMDCPSRERAAWLCDSFFAARVAFDLSGNTLVEKNFLENYLLPETYYKLPAGMLPMCYPSDHANGTYIPNWAMWFVLELQEYRARSQDQKMVDALHPKIDALLKFFEKYENDDGLLENLESWVFVEWSEANKYTKGVSYPTNMLYAGTLDAAGDLYGRADLKAKAARIRDTIRKQSFDGEFFIDNAERDRKSGKLQVTKNCSEACQYYAFYFGVATPTTHPELREKLVTQFGPARNAEKVFPQVRPANVFVGHYLRMELLSQYGLTPRLADEVKTLFVRMADTTGTLWESMETMEAVWSCSHGFAAHAAHVLYRDFLGLRITDVAGKKVLVRFNDLPIESCEGTLPIGDKAISLKWKKENGKLLYSLELPVGWTATVENNTGLPAEKTK